METSWQRLLQRIHPEGIPWPASLLYSALSGSGAFLQHYDLVAQDVARYGPARSPAQMARMVGSCP